MKWEGYKNIWALEQKATCLEMEKMETCLVLVAEGLGGKEDHVKNQALRRHFHSNH